MSKQRKSGFPRSPLRILTTLACVAAAVFALGLLTWKLVQMAQEQRLKLEQRRRYQRILDQFADCKPAVRWSMGKPVEIYFHNLFANFNLQDSDLALLRQIPTLRVLSIEFAPNLSDEGVAHLGELKQLRSLCIKFTPITDAALAPLNGLTDVRLVDLEGTNITDAGLGQLAELPRLGGLSLRNCNVTDEGLLIVARSRTLRFLSVSCDGSNVTEAGLERLGREAPHLDVDRILPPIDPDPWGDRFGARAGPPYGHPDWTPIILAEVTEGRIVAQLACCVTPEELARMELKPSEAQAAGPSLFEAIRGKLPAKVVEWFAERLTPQNATRAVSDQQLKALLHDGLLVDFTAGCRRGTSRTKSIIIK